MIVMILAAVSVTAATPPSAPQQPLNQQCPVLTDQPVDPNITTTYQDQTIAFCCEHCRAKFNANPGKYTHNLPQFTRPETEDTHDHSASNGDQRRIPLLGRLHPVIVHFPVAGIPLALLGFLAWTVTARGVFDKADIPPLFVATPAAVAAVITGDIRHEAMTFSDALHDIVEYHELAGFAVMILCLILTALRIWRWNRLTGPARSIYAAGLVLATLAVAVAGYLGGSLVFGLDHFKW